MLSEQEIFNQLSTLCSQKGFIHALVKLNFDNNYYRANKNGNFTSNQIVKSHINKEKVIRAELLTLLALVIKNNPYFFQDEKPIPEILEKNIQTIKELLNNLHNIFTQPIVKNMREKANVMHTQQNFELFNESDVFLTEESIREAIFYGGDGVYSFQYQDLGCLKYLKDNDWFVKNKGFSIRVAFYVLEIIFDLHHIKIDYALTNKNEISLEDFILSKTEIINFLEKKSVNNFPIDELQSFIDAFCLKNIDDINNFRQIDDFNPLSAYPFINLSDDKFLIFDLFTISQALYETPFFWMLNDKQYKNIALKNRGDFTEDFTYKILCNVFGEKNVWKNVDLYSEHDGIKSKNKSGEIDILVNVSGHALVFQAKAKKLTLESRKGNIAQISNDFSKAIQDAYDQAVNCSEILLTNQYTAKVNNEIIRLPKIEFCYPICILSEYFPALVMQVRLLLEEHNINNIAHALVLDVFLLDLMSKTLLTPLDFLHFISSFSKSRSIFLANTQIEILSSHLKANWLCLEEDVNLVYLDDSLSFNLDIYISKIRGKMLDEHDINIPSGWLKFKDTYWWELFNFLSPLDSQKKLKLGLLMMQCSGELIENYNLGINQCIRSLNHNKTQILSDFSLYIGDKSGLTVYVTDHPITTNDLIKKINTHAILKKYHTHADLWFALILSKQGKVKYFDVLDFEWKYNQEIQNIYQNTLGKNNIFKTLTKGRVITKKIGRNEPCPCNSGKKYKHCCLKNR
ncbi:hypothetical protein D0T92_00510 [Neisseria zalophi]|uniref:Prepilin peptidase n=2 Tax=Neisseria zalophi TaxID=640030 RepID=A0A5J6PVU0_9NEIS|nr:hypothetical protein D0T92_00510 [Neisseria zalophi]